METLEKAPIQIDWDEVKVAKSLIGQKVIVLGGGQFAQYCYIGKLNTIYGNGQANLTMLGWSYPYEEEATFTPWIASWYLRPLPQQYQHLPLGQYDLLAGQRNKPREPLVLIKEEK